MRLGLTLKSILLIASVILFDTCVPAFAAPLPKSYAVFVATFDPLTGQAVGGVAGSAFFVSPTQAITAFHVLQPKSFANPRTQIWLVHEGEAAIELQASWLKPEADLDRTTITLHETQANLVYELGLNRVEAMAPAASSDDVISTDGFVASSVGPLLAPRGDGHLTVTAVPHLQRLHAEGTLLQRQSIELTSNDVNLKNAPCVQLSYRPVVGLSGGPVTRAGRVIAMNSFADPKARASTWAVSIDSLPVN